MVLRRRNPERVSICEDGKDRCKRRNFIGRRAAFTVPYIVQILFAFADCIAQMLLRHASDLAALLDSDFEDIHIEQSNPSPFVHIAESNESSINPLT